MFYVFVMFGDTRSCAVVGHVTQPSSKAILEIVTAEKSAVRELFKYLVVNPSHRTSPVPSVFRRQHQDRLEHEELRESRLVCSHGGVFVNFS